MLKRLSTQLKRNKDTNGDTEPKTKENGSKRFSKASPSRKSVSNEENHQVKRAEVVAVFEKYAQAIHASREPLPNQTGDGTYLKHDKSSGLINDIKSLGFRDVNTVKDLIKSKASGELVDDKTYLMERIIQVRTALSVVNRDYNGLIQISIADGCRYARSLEEPYRAHQPVPG
jgi:linoleate 10R-lipoxygenase